MRAPKRLKLVNVRFASIGQVASFGAQTPWPKLRIFAAAAGIVCINNPISPELLRNNKLSGNSKEDSFLGAARVEKFRAKSRQPQ